MDIRNFILVDYATINQLPPVITNDRILKNYGMLEDLIIDGVSIEVNDTILVKNQIDLRQNGLYKLIQKYEFNNNNNNIPFILERIHLNLIGLIVVGVRFGNTLEHSNWITNLGIIYTPGVTEQLYTLYMSQTFNNMQNVYNNGPEIFIDETIGPLVLRDIEPSQSSNLFEITNNDKTNTYFSVNQDEITINGKLTVTGLLDPTGCQFIEQSSNPGIVAPGNGTIWVRNDSPNVLIYTDDLGNDTVLGLTGEETLQETYDYSSTGIIILDSIRGPFGLRDNINPLNTNLFEVQNYNQSIKYFTVDSNGVSIEGTLLVSDDTTINGILLVNDDTAINGELIVDNNTTINGELLVENNTTINSELLVENNTIINGELLVNNNTIINGELLVNNDTTIDGNLIITGTTFSVESENILIDNNFLILNQNYTFNSPQTGGIVVNYYPTLITDTVYIPGFIEGINGISNPSVGTNGVSTFNTGDIIMITNANNISNNGIFEVLSHSSNELIIRGIGITSTIENFSLNQFITDNTPIGNITKINISVLQTNNNGFWEIGTNNITPITYETLIITSTNIGGGIEIFNQKVNSNFEFRTLIPQSNKIIINQNTDNISIDIDEFNIDINDISGILNVNKGGTGNNSHNQGNVLIGQGTNPISSTKSAPSGDFVGTNDSQILTNKTINSDDNTLIIDADDITTGIIPVIRGGTGNNTHTAGNVLVGDDNNPILSNKSAPDGDFVGTTDSQTLTNKTMNTSHNTFILDTSDITSGQLSVPRGGTGIDSHNQGNVLIGEGTNPISSNKSAPDGDFVGTTDSQILTNKIMDTSDNIFILDTSDITSGQLSVSRGGTGTNTHTAGNVLVGEGTNAISSTKLAPSGDFVGTTDSQTLTNKNITGLTNNIGATQLETNDIPINITSNSPNGSNEILLTIDNANAIWTPLVNVTTKKATYTLSSVKIQPVSSTYETIAYFPWDGNEYDSLYSNGILRFYVEHTDLNLDIRATNDNGISTDEITGISSTDIFTLQLNNSIPGNNNGLIEIQIRTSGSGDIEPKIKGLNLEFDQ
jgi:hypothetical protein